MNGDTAGDGGQVVCERCLTRPATVHISRVVNGERTDRYLCEACAKEEGAFPLPFNPQFTLQQLLSGLMGQPQAPGQPRPALTADRQCPACGYRYSQFVDSGRLGCPGCYDAFREELIPLIRRLHGSTQHRGKVPLRAGRQLRRLQDLERLREELRQAVAREEFERAAALRDRIRELEQGGGDSPGPAGEAKA
ncbi:Nucleotide excision repair protein, with UvrB/UvrC motif [Candidatus Hydrogenisulfobacillus filiaventi]|uniref:Nucleotide excision repair protein, with UvrB/UvrC motif n=1 Tax=Candidatus Hydrogenisulfobacillus filiaventi TaxID=2707344 RepID=A0A6F8ZJ78_9FIRM|nr:UvrB/UvrC motif-containing protein [Bacillota bacterium]CAB1129994.1 Nucleotide excision repair protein, with UvrB/UvrC motif [Candidatus Hydrogenisulfobacillus filiaventi]